jgi:excisionase family DNA binding protein
MPTDVMPRRPLGAGLLTVAQAAERLGRSESWLHRWINDGDCPFVFKLRRRWVISEERLEAFVRGEVA